MKSTAVYLFDGPFSLLLWFCMDPDTHLSEFFLLTFKLYPNFAFLFLSKLSCMLAVLWQSGFWRSMSKSYKSSSWRKFNKSLSTLFRILTSNMILNSVNFIELCISFCYTSSHHTCCVLLSLQNSPNKIDVIADQICNFGITSSLPVDFVGYNHTSLVLVQVFSILVACTAQFC